MNAKQAKLLADADAMSESTLVSMEDWELAYLRVAMRNQVEETLNAALFGNHADASNNTLNNSPTRERGVMNNTDDTPKRSDATKRSAEPHASAWGCGNGCHSSRKGETASLVEAAR